MTTTPTLDPAAELQLAKARLLHAKAERLERETEFGYPMAQPSAAAPSPPDVDSGTMSCIDPAHRVIAQALASHLNAPLDDIRWNEGPPPRIVDRIYLVRSLSVATSNEHNALVTWVGDIASTAAAPDDEWLRTGAVQSFYRHTITHHAVVTP